MGKYGNRLNQHLNSSWWVYLFIVLCFLAGFVFGSTGVKTLTEQQASSLQQYIMSGVAQLQEQPDYTAITMSALQKNIAALGKIFLLGLTVIGFPLILVIVFTRGFVLGFSLIFLLQERNLLEGTFALLAVVLPNILSLPAIFLAGVFAVNFSLYLLKGRDSTRLSFTQYFLGYLLLFFFLALIMAAAAFLEGYFSPFFIRMIAD